MTYIFDFIDLSGQIDHFDMVMCPDDIAARAAAEMALAGSSTAVGVRIWNGERWVAEIAPPAPMPRVQFGHRVDRFGARRP